MNVQTKSTEKFSTLLSLQGVTLYLLRYSALASIAASNLDPTTNGAE